MFLLYLELQICLYYFVSFAVFVDLSSRLYKKNGLHRKLWNILSTLLCHLGLLNTPTASLQSGKTPTLCVQ